MKTNLLGDLGYQKKTLGSTYIEWVNEKEDVRISKVGGTFLIRQNTKNKPISITEKELMALLIDTGLAELTGETE